MPSLMDTIQPINIQMSIFLFLTVRFRGRYKYRYLGHEFFCYFAKSFITLLGITYLAWSPFFQILLHFQFFSCSELLGLSSVFPVQHRGGNIMKEAHAFCCRLIRPKPQPSLLHTANMATILPTQGGKRPSTSTGGGRLEPNKTTAKKRGSLPAPYAEFWNVYLFLSMMYNMYVTTL